MFCEFTALLSILLLFVFSALMLDVSSIATIEGNIILAIY